MASHIVSTILITNLHCTSCVHTIEYALASLSPPPSSVTTSIVTQSVTIHHSQELSCNRIQATLEDAGFDVSVPASALLGERRSFHERISGVSSFLAGKHRKHMQQCSLCQETYPSSSDIDKVALIPELHNIGYTSNSDDTNQQPQDLHTTYTNATDKLGPPSSERELNHDPCRITLSIGGMTCSSCSRTIADMVSPLSGVSDITVNLLSNSATVVVESKDFIDSVVETIDDCGFEVEVIKMELVSPEPQVADEMRTISIRIDGMFCEHCPDKIMNSLQNLSPQLKIVKAITDYRDPTIEISYKPVVPSFTIRTIVATIASVEPDTFKVSIHHPPPLEQRTRSMQVHEQRILLQRLIFAVVVAIPTFIIGVVYMSLVSSDNRSKRYLSEPMWAGNASRFQWALFFLATPVMIYSAGLFHRRSFIEIKSLWRKGSTTPLIKRFTRFGSMNLLVSTGVSVAYFSSIALLVLSAAQPASPNGDGEMTTYFDSVVFLTMFLLAGRVLEAYSKARTADAITALGALRPTEALLITPKDNSHHITSPTPTVAREETRFADEEKGDPNSDGGILTAQPGLVVSKVHVEFLEIGDIVRVQNGATPPADGIIVSSHESTFDESSLTGESRPVKKHKDDRVFLGTVNKSAVVDVKIDTIGGITMLDHIVQVVREGQTRRAPIERVADIITGVFVPVVTLLAVTTWVIWLALGLGGALPKDYLDIPVGGWTVWSFEFAIAVFVVACPCGIGLAAPTALLVGSGLAAKFGILARGGGEAFQEMAQLDVVVFDKTGTLTEGGQPRVSDCEIPAYGSDGGDKWDRKTILAIAFEVESTSSHPFATAIRHYCQSEGASSASGSEFEEVAGRGLSAEFGELGCEVIIGNEAWMDEHEVVISDAIAQKLETWKSDAKSLVLLAIRDSNLAENPFRIAAVFSVSDPLRPEAKAIIRCLQDRGIDTWMISGDNEITAKAVAGAVGIPIANVIAGVLPHQKAENIRNLQENGKRKNLPRWRRLFRTGSDKKLNERCIVAMVGDGINDAPALAASDVGIAIGSGSDVALSSASFILVSSNLTSLLTLSDLSRKVFNRVKLNFLWALIYNLIALPIAAGVIYPAGHARLKPVWASLSMALSSVSVVCSSLHLKLYKEPKTR